MIISTFSVEGSIHSNKVSHGILLRRPHFVGYWGSNIRYLQSLYYQDVLPHSLAEKEQVVSKVLT